MFLNQPKEENLFDSMQLSTKQLQKENLLQIDGLLTINRNVLNLITEV